MTKFLARSYPFSLINGPKLLPPATKWRQSNVFTPVCDSVREGCLCLGGSLSRGVSVLGSLSRGVFVQGVCICPGGSLPRGISVQGRGCLSGGSLSRGSLSGRHSIVQLHVGGTHPTGMHPRYCLPMKLWEGNVFTGVCLSTGGGESLVPGPFQGVSMSKVGEGLGCPGG